MFKVGMKLIDLGSPDIFTIDAIVDAKCVSMTSDVSGEAIVIPTSILKISVNSGKSVVWVHGEVIKQIS